MLFQNVKADASIIVDVRMIDFGFKGNLLNTQYNSHYYNMAISLTFDFDRFFKVTKKEFKTAALGNNN